MAKLTYAFIYHKNSQQEKLTFFTYEVALNGLVIFLIKEEKKMEFVFCIQIF